MPAIAAPNTAEICLFHTVLRSWNQEHRQDSTVVQNGKLPDLWIVWNVHVKKGAICTHYRKL
jgi:hypothetical protein